MLKFAMFHGDTSPPLARCHARLQRVSLELLTIMHTYPSLFASFLEIFSRLYVRGRRKLPDRTER